MTKYLYVFKGGGLSKVGSTSDIKKRLSTLNRLSPTKIENVWYTDTSDNPRAEDRIHSIFSSKRVHGEWFRLTDTDIEKIKFLTTNQKEMEKEFSQISRFGDDNLRQVEIAGQLHRCVSVRDFSRHPYKVLPQAGESLLITKRNVPTYMMTNLAVSEDFMSVNIHNHGEGVRKNDNQKD
jgi:hypothetical protein